MCVAYPGRIVEIHGEFARVDFGAGTIRDNILISLVNAKVGDYILVHAGYAIQVVDEEEAKKTIEMWEEMTKELDEEQKKRDLYEAIGSGSNE
ncbi:HypC/HybG/HupF family hydrogenase formation chaperone [Saccharolobus shibatae]|uniref:[NiFe] hydrogenase metallocenter assembly protein HypC n=1 Tax=Saccharolobus shibatae TaxID=2286 RepID=A0A8F5C1Q4_9CREN|nr:HypC/HybG/HupF family hydrogenase formation chaperone [Saccharolobus shibatae]QXJ35514.1 [NiFe] hydrogenase metallocenter assembly protein HypC [Saccharolobus shibatae]